MVGEKTSTPAAYSARTVWLTTGPAPSRDERSRLGRPPGGGIGSGSGSHGVFDPRSARGARRRSCVGARRRQAARVAGAAAAARSRAGQRRADRARALGRGRAGGRGRRRCRCTSRGCGGRSAAPTCWSRRAPATRLRARPGELDAERFAQLVADGRAPWRRASPRRAAAVLREALALWRGPPLGDLGSLPFAPAEIARLEEQRAGRAGAARRRRSGRGRHAELVAELAGLVQQHPWRERLHAQLMLALYRSGRQADALDAYRACARGAGRAAGDRARARSCTDLHGRVLAQDPGARRAGRRRMPRRAQRACRRRRIARSAASGRSPRSCERLPTGRSGCSR